MVDVLQVQGLINKLNYTSTLAEDGIQGRMTNSAMEKFEVMFPSEGKCNTFSLKRIIKQKESNILVVPYVTQRDGYEYSYRMCNLACLNMLLKFYGNNKYDIKALDKIVDTDIEIQTYAESHLLYGRNTGKLEQNSQILVLLLKKILKKDAILKYSTKDEMIELLKTRPIILGTKLSGYMSKDATKGHYVVLVGHWGDYSVIHDPYGLYSEYNSYDSSTKGKYVVIPDSILFGEYGCKTAYEEVSRTEENKTKYRTIFVK